MELSREQMLSALMASDASYNGRFVTGVLSTGIYCLPSCHARKPKPENVQFFRTFAEARAAGLRACRKCRPDHFERGEGDEDEAQVEALVAKLGAHPDRFATPTDLAAELGIGETKLYGLIRRHYHVAPAQLLRNHRVDAAARLLLQNDATVAEVAFAVGYESLSAFYEHFAERVGMVPTAYRSLTQSDQFTLTLPPNFPSARILGHLGRDPDSLSERVGGRDASVGFCLEDPAAVHIRFEESWVAVRSEGVPGEQMPEVHRAVRRLLGFDQDPEGFAATALRSGFGALAAKNPGLRYPLTPVPFDALVWSIVGQQVGLGFAFKMRRRLTELVGLRLPSGIFATPPARRIANLDPSDLAALQFSARKSEYLLGIARNVPDLTGSATAIERRLMATRGFGPWATNYVLMRGLGFGNCVPLGDTGLLAGLRKLHNRKVEASEVERLMATFAPHRSLATFHLWTSLQEG